MKVQVTIEIPDGYELACDEMRTPKEGEIFIASDGSITKCAYEHGIFLYRIILKKKACQPEAGKVYMFWDDFGVVTPAIFVGMSEDGEYITADRCSWDNCGPLTDEEIGR